MQGFFFIYNIFALFLPIRTLGVNIVTLLGFFFFVLFCFERFIYLYLKEKEGKGTGREIFHSLVQFPNGQSWAGPRLGSRPCSRSPSWQQGPKTLGYLPLLFQVVKRGAASGMGPPGLELQVLACWATVCVPRILRFLPGGNEELFSLAPHVKEDSVLSIQIFCCSFFVLHLWCYYY